MSNPMIWLSDYKKMEKSSVAIVHVKQGKYLLQ